jgi:hypothetical protein
LFHDLAPEKFGGLPDHGKILCIADDNLFYNMRLTGRSNGIGGWSVVSEKCVDRKTATGYDEKRPNVRRPSGRFWAKDTFFTDMTAIALVTTKAGIVVAADGLSRWGDDSTRDDLSRQQESDHEKKVFKAEFGTLDIAWAVTGSVFNKDRSFSLLAEAKKAFRAANAESHQHFCPWLDLFAVRQRDSVSDAIKSGSIGPPSENPRIRAFHIRQNLNGWVRQQRKALNRDR